MTSIKIDPKYKSSIGIIVVGYNRYYSLNRLLESLKKAKYTSTSIPLVISIDCSGDERVYDLARAYEWPFGDKYVIIQEERQGLKQHILKCGDLSQYFKAIILLEDDVYVSEFFYDYTQKAVEYYYEEQRVGGISLYQDEVVGQFPAVYLNNGSSTYLKQNPSSWGECWTDKQWRGFREWLDGFNVQSFDRIDMPLHMKKWDRAWSIYFLAYLIETKRYVVYPYISLTTCFGDAGEHSTSTSAVGQVCMLSNQCDFLFRPYDEMVKYDIYGVNEDIYTWLKIPKEDLCVDWYGLNPNIRNCRYILTPIRLKIQPIRSFGLTMRPIELNVKNSIKGEDLLLYDNTEGNCRVSQKKLPVSMAHYYLRFFDSDLIVKYMVDMFKKRLANKLRLFAIRHRK